MRRTNKQHKDRPPMPPELLASPTHKEAHPDFSYLFDYLNSYAQRVWQEHPHGDAPRWQAAIDRAYTAYQASDVRELRAALMDLHPWRRGPYEIALPQGGTLTIDSEWQSQYKWNRLAPLGWEGKRVLDVGASNGYYLHRMTEAGAALAIALDPTLIDAHQFAILNRIYGNDKLIYYPLRDEALDGLLKGDELIAQMHTASRPRESRERGAFDRILSMGVLYHHKDPCLHIRRLLALLARDGELILETIVAPESIIKPERYAKMRNISIIPDLRYITQVVEKAGGRIVEQLGPFETTTEEQRTTEWMSFQSLADFLDPLDPTKTVEGYAAPTRVISVIKKAARES